MTADEVRERVREACRQAGSARAWGRDNDISSPYINDVLLGRRDPGAKILDALGLTKTVDYVETP